MSSRPRQDRARSSDEEIQRTRGISPTGAVLALILVLVFMYAVRWALLPFVISAVAAYIFTPLIQWLTKRTHIPRIFFVCAVFITLLAVGVTIIVLGAAPLIREATATVADLGETMERLARGAIGDRSIEFLGQSMNARQVAQAAVSAKLDRPSRGDFDARRLERRRPVRNLSDLRASVFLFERWSAPRAQRLMARPAQAPPDRGIHLV
jgi:hypothetical protein